MAIEQKFKLMTNVSPMGTVSYMAPEMYRKILTNKSDIWSAGVLATILLTGKSPIPGETNNEIINNILNVNMDLNSAQFKNISAEAKDLLTKMFEKDFHKRAGANELLKHPFLVKSMSHVPISQVDIAEI